jgi:hypothetical protein
MNIEMSLIVIAIAQSIKFNDKAAMIVIFYIDCEVVCSEPRRTIHGNKQRCILTTASTQTQLLLYTLILALNFC